VPTPALALDAHAPDGIGKIEHREHDAPLVTDLPMTSICSYRSNPSSLCTRAAAPCDTATTPGASAAAMHRCLNDRHDRTSTAR
jgi:hypothetical protein